MLHRIHEYDRGLLFRRGAYIKTLGPGRHLIPPFCGYQLRRITVRQTRFLHSDLDLIANSAEPPAELRIVEVLDHQRGLLWIDGRFADVLMPGRFAYWTVLHEVEIELIDTLEPRFTHAKSATVLAHADAIAGLYVVNVPPGSAALVYQAGTLIDTVHAGRHAYWETSGAITVRQLSLREQALEISGQEIITADKVSLRINAQVTFTVTDISRAVDVVEDFHSSIYRQAQLVLRALVGTRDLDALLTDKESLATEFQAGVATATERLGVSLSSAGVRDIILPGDMKGLMNRVTEAQKAAEAAIIKRREETAAMRSQANTAKILDANPTLMRLRELEAMERVAENAQLTLVLGEQGLSDRLSKLV
jgi:regulator of protease activity HflC (stomatin/prohibitin superfamily)